MAKKPQGSNGRKHRVTLTVIPTLPDGASAVKLQDGPFVAQHGADTELVCGTCGKVVFVLPHRVFLAGDKGPVILICYSCGANNVAPTSYD
jgi:hypothetical protein